MDARAMEIQSKRNGHLSIKIIPGHFATSHSHVNYYIDMTSIKCVHTLAKEAATDLASHYASVPVDTIVCLDETEIIGAFLASTLAGTSIAGINRHQNINIVTPEINSSNQMLFRDNVQPLIWGKNTLLLVASVTTGKTINRALDCLKYYGSKNVGICALFSAVDSALEEPINSIFDNADIVDYHQYSAGDCPICKEGKKIDAIINSYGYSKL